MYALDLNTNRVLASIWYWNYGDYNPIAHHLCAFPSADPYRCFEFVNSTQGGQNSLIYGINTKIRDARPRVQHLSRGLRRRADGGDRERLGNDRPGARRARHGQPEGCPVLLRHRRPEGHRRVLRPQDLARQGGAEIRLGGESKELREAWMQGGTLKIKKIYPDAKTGKYDYQGTKGNKIDWEMVPMGELFVEEGTVPGDSPHTLSGADGTIWHPTGRWAATVVRLCGGICILDPENNFDPVAFLQFNKDSRDQYPVKRIDNDHWEVVFDKIHSPGHEIGFSPDGRFLCMMNNLRENNIARLQLDDPDPTKWRKVAHVEDPLWRGKYPNPFHMVFSMDNSKLYLSILHPSPA